MLCRGKFLQKNRTFKCLFENKIKTRLRGTLIKYDIRRKYRKHFVHKIFIARSTTVVVKYI